MACHFLSYVVSNDLFFILNPRLESLQNARVGPYGRKGCGHVRRTEHLVSIVPIVLLVHRPAHKKLTFHTGARGISPTSKFLAWLYLCH